MGFAGGKVLSLDCKEDPQSQRRCYCKSEGLKTQNFHENVIENQVHRYIDQTGNYGPFSPVFKCKERSKLVSDQQGHDSDGLSQKISVEKRPYLRIFGEYPCQIKDRKDNEQDRENGRYKERDYYVQRIGILKAVLLVFPDIGSAENSGSAYQHDAYGSDEQIEREKQSHGSHGIHTDIVACKEIRTGPPGDFLKPDGLTLPVEDNVILLEVKWDEYLPGVIRKAAALKSREPTAFSKYAACRVYC